MYVPVMFEWPRFAAHLCSDRSPKDRLESLLRELGEPLTAEPEAGEVLESLFSDRALIDGLRAYATCLHHVGILAPPGLDLAAAGEAVAASPFAARLKTFKSVVLAKDLSAHVGHCVDVSVVNGFASSRPLRFPEVEVFVASLPAAELEPVVADEFGCHVALGLRADTSFPAVLDLLHAHRCWELPLMRSGPLTNSEIKSRVLYVDVERDGRMRRLEFIAATAP